MDHIQCGTHAKDCFGLRFSMTKADQKATDSYENLKGKENKI